MCNRPKCMFRHMNVRKFTPCYWESQPGGCQKPHCPFLHEKSREQHPEAVNAPPQPGNKIFVNKNKIAELGSLNLPVAIQDALAEGSNSGYGETSQVNA